METRTFNDEWRIDDALLYSDLLVLDNGGLPNMSAGLTKNSSVPSVSGGVLWADEVNKRFFAFGGYFPNSLPTPFATWSYRTDHDAWDMVATDSNPNYLAYGMGAVAPEAGVGYYLGGYQDNQTTDAWTGDRLYSPNLVEFDMVKSQYRNISGPNAVGRGEGLMVFVPASISGILVYFGGVLQDPSTREIIGVGISSNVVSQIKLTQSDTHGCMASLLCTLMLDTNVVG